MHSPGTGSYSLLHEWPFLSVRLSLSRASHPQAARVPGHQLRACPPAMIDAHSCARTMSPISSFIVSNDQVHWVLKTTPGKEELRLGVGLHQGVHACHKAQLQGSGASA